MPFNYPSALEQSIYYNDYNDSSSISFEGERLLSKKHVSASGRRIISLSQIFAGQVGVISVATVTSQVEHAPRG